MYKVQIIVEATQEIIEEIDNFGNGTNRPFFTYKEAEEFAIIRTERYPELTYDILEV